MHKPELSLFTRRRQSFKRTLGDVNIMPNLRSGSHNHSATHTQNSVHSTMPCCFSLVSIQLTAKAMLKHALKISQGCKQSRLFVPPILNL